MTAILRPDVLAARRVTVATAAGDVFATAAAERAGALGASVSRLDVDPFAAAEPQAAAADVLVWDGAAAFTSAPGVEGVRAALDGAWLAIRAVFATRLEPGAIVLLSPPPGDAHATAARAGLENLARTLSIEWARYEIRPVALLPGATSSREEVAEITAYLASSAGAYYSGCTFTLA